MCSGTAWFLVDVKIIWDGFWTCDLNPEKAACLLRDRTETAPDELQFWTAWDTAHMALATLCNVRTTPTEQESLNTTSCRTWFPAYYFHCRQTLLPAEDAKLCRRPCRLSNRTMTRSATAHPTEVECLPETVTMVVYLDQRFFKLFQSRPPWR